MSLYRLKGFVRFAGADPQWKYGLHAVGAYLRFQPVPWERGEPRTIQLVMIGTGIDADTLTKRLTDCVATPPGRGRRAAHDGRAALRGRRGPEGRYGAPKSERVTEPSSASGNPGLYETSQA